MNGTPTVVALVPDLMDRSKVRSAFPTVVLVNRPADLAGAVAEHHPGLVVVDLSRSGVLEAVTGLAARVAQVIGFASHVDEATLAAAREAGIEALPRSVFFRRLPSLGTGAGEAPDDPGK